MLTLKPSDFQPAKKKKQISTTRTKTKSADAHTKKKSFRPAHRNQAPYDPRSKTKFISSNKLKPSIFRPAHKTEVNFYPNTKNQVNHFRPGHNRSRFDPRIKNMSRSIPTQKPNRFRSRKWKPSAFRPCHWNEANCDLHSNIQSISMPRRINPVNFNTDAKNKSFSTATTMPTGQSETKFFPKIHTITQFILS